MHATMGLFVVQRTAVIPSVQSALDQCKAVVLDVLATDVASAALDYSKGNVQDGVINSPPSRSAGRMLVYLPSPLRDYRSTSIQ